MRILLAGVLATLLAGAVAADDKTGNKKPAEPTGLEALKSEYSAAQRRYAQAQGEAVKALREAKTDEERKEAQQKLQDVMKDSPLPKFGPRFLEYAEKNPAAADRFDALMMAFSTSAANAKVRGQAIEALRKDFVKKPEIARALRALNGGDEASAALLKAVAEQHPDRKVQARALKTLADAKERSAQSGERMEKDEALRERMVKARGQEAVDKMIANAVKDRKEADLIRRQIEEKYADVMVNLAIGKPAPEVKSQDADGKPVKLSDLRGKVVVLDIWATWCGPCRAMIPHEREMVARLKDKPFVLVSISGDEKKETLVEFLKKNEMPWTHWWEGRGGLMEDWDIQYFPTIYVLDAKGVIRHKDLRGEKLEEAVNELLKEMEKK